MMVTYFLLLSLVLTTMTLWGSFETQRFLKDHAVIDGPIAIEAFKTLARRNMFAALIYIVLGILSLMLAGQLVVQLKLIGTATVLAVYVPSFILNRRLLALERQARNLHCTTADLQALHAQIGQTWVKKALPDF